MARVRFQQHSRARNHLIAWVGLAALAAMAFPRTAVALDANRALTQYLHHIWQLGQGLPDATINSLVQTPDGYLWLGMQRGVARFDGVRFTSIDHIGSTSLADVFVSDMAVGPTGRIWLATNGSGLVRIENGSARRFSTRDGLPSDTIDRVVACPDDTLWLCTPAGLSRFDRDAFHNFTMADGLASNDVRAVCEAPDGRTWIGSDSTKLNIWDGRQMTAMPLAGLPSYTGVQAILAGADGSIWVGTTSGLVCITGTKQRLFTTGDGLADNTVFSLAPGADGVVWVGTHDGFSRIRNGEIESFRARDGLSQSTVYALLEDREGSLWVGTKHGLNQFVDRRIVTFTSSEGLPSDDTGPVLQDTHGNIWIGTLGAGLSRFDGRRIAIFTVRDGLASDFITSLEDDKLGNLWVGTDHGVTRMAGDGSMHTFSTTNGLPSNSVTCVFRDDRQRLWIGTSAGLARLDDAGVHAEPSLTLPVVAIGQGAGGNILVATAGDGVYVEADGRFAPFDPNSTALRGVDALCRDSDGLVWMGLQGGGLRLLQGGKIVRFSISDGLFDDDIFGICCEGRDRLWMACSKGTFSVSRSDLLDFAAGKLAHFKSQQFSPIEAQRTVECKPGVQPAVFRANDGRLWFSTVRGAIVIDPAHLQISSTPPTVAIEDVIVDGKSADAAEIASLPPGVTNLEFRYTGLSFLVPSRITFRYKLDGFDKDWVDAGTRREAFYTNLPSGKFRFLVTAANMDGVYNPVAGSLAMGIQPHVYQRPLFFALCGAAALMIGWLWYQFHMGRIRQRMQVILSERGRIARELHDTLIQGFSGVTAQMQALSVRLASSNQRQILDEIIRDAGVCLKEARQSVAGLRNSGGRVTGLDTALEQTARQLTEARDIRVRLRLAPPPPLPPEVEYNLLRIAQEAITNSVKHSGTRSVEVRLETTAAEVRLNISDHGCGFVDGNATNTTAGHYGLIGMKERATQIGADFVLTSEPGRGTKVIVSLPLRKSA